MKKLLPLLLFVAINPAFSQSSGIKFMKGTWTDIKRTADESNKPIFVFAHTP